TTSLGGGGITLFIACLTRNEATLLWVISRLGLLGIVRHTLPSRVVTQCGQKFRVLLRCHICVGKGEWKRSHCLRFTFERKLGAFLTSSACLLFGGGSSNLTDVGSLYPRMQIGTIGSGLVDIMDFLLKQGKFKSA